MEKITMWHWNQHCVQPATGELCLAQQQFGICFLQLLKDNKQKTY